MNEQHGHAEDPGSSSDQLSPAEPDGEEQVLEDALSPVSSQEGRARLPIYAVIPEEVIRASPEEFTSFLEAIFAEDDVLEKALDLVLTPDTAPAGERRQVVRAVVPSQALRAQGFNPAELLDELFEAFSEIDEALVSLQEINVSGGEPSASHPTTCVVPDSVIADPEALAQAIVTATDTAAKLDLLLRQARQVLKRLEIYRLSKRHPHELIEMMARAGDLNCVQYLVEFLHAIHTAADSFETLELPRYHIRDYLKHLYLMEDWEAMEALVGRLEKAVLRYTEISSAPQTPSDPD